MKDNFSQQSAGYAQFRPNYPAELVEYIVSFVEEKGLAWDCGTGNGQSAKLLAHHFKKVFATDISSKQLANAHAAANIFYAREPAEKTSLANDSVNLVTVAQAIHWFDFEKFYTEVNRVAKPGAVIAVWTYSLLQVSPEIDSIIHEYHFKTLEKYWDPERKYVDDGYSGIPFPFATIETKPFNIELDWTLEELNGYLHTWSALQKFMAVNTVNPVPAIMEKIQQHWGDPARQRICFPVYLKLGIIK